MKWKAPGGPRDTHSYNHRDLAGSQPSLKIQVMFCEYTVPVCQSSPSGPYPTPIWFNNRPIRAFLIDESSASPFEAVHIVEGGSGMQY